MNKQYGVTLIELMVAILISLIVLAGVSSVFISTIQSSREVVAGARLNQEMGLILDRIVSDIRRAGYWGDEILNIDVGDRDNPFMNREFNSEVRHPPMQPEGMPGIRLQAA